MARIKGAIIDELRSLDWVPRSVRARARDMEKAHAKLEDALQRAPTDEEMAKELKMSVDEFRDSLLEIANSSVLALDDLWTVRRPRGRRRPDLRCSTRSGPRRDRPAGRDSTPRAQGPPRRRRSSRCPSASGS